MVEQKFEPASVMMETVFAGIEDTILQDDNDNKDGDMDETLKMLIKDIDSIFKDLELESRELENREVDAHYDDPRPIDSPEDLLAAFGPPE